MRQLFLSIILVSLITAFLPGRVFAGPIGSVCCDSSNPASASCDGGLICNTTTHLCEACPGGGICLPNPLKYCAFEDLIDAIVSFLFTASLLLAPIMVLIGAFTLMTAAGNPAKIKTANNIFIYTGIGLLVVFMGKGLVSAIKALMGG